MTDSDWLFVLGLLVGIGMTLGALGVHNWAKYR